jgi:hypothetical protein
LVPPEKILNLLTFRTGNPDKFIAQQVADDLADGGLPDPGRADEIKTVFGVGRADDVEDMLDDLAIIKEAIRFVRFQHFLNLHPHVFSIKITVLT